MWNYFVMEREKLQPQCLYKKYFPLQLWEKSVEGKARFVFLYSCSYKVVQEVQEGQAYSWLHYRRGKNQKPEASSLSVWAYFWCMPLFHLSQTTQILSCPSRQIYQRSHGWQTPGCGLIWTVLLGKFRCLIWKCPFTDLSVGYADEPLIDQLVCFGVSGLSLHDVALGCFISQGDGRDLGDNK